MIEALREYGLFKGGWLGVIRVCKCHPFHPGGCDPVPEKKQRIDKHKDLAHG